MERERRRKKGRKREGRQREEKRRKGKVKHCKAYSRLLMLFLSEQPCIKLEGGKKAKAMVF